MNGFCYRFGVRARRERLEGGGAIVNVDAILLDAFPCLETLTFLARDYAVAQLQYILKPQAIVPRSPYVVFSDGSPRKCRDVISEDRIYP